MVRFLVRTLVMLLANAIGLWIASMVLEGMSLTVTGFITVVVLFTVLLALMTPFLASRFRKHQSSALGGVALIATLVSLVVTAAISDGLTIDGLGTWIAASVIVWAVALLAAFLLPYLGLKKFMDEKR